MKLPKSLIILFALLTIPSVAGAQTEITEHLKTVESHLRAKDVSQWSAAKQNARTKTLNTLRTYYERGIYPKNIDFPEARVPYFVDHKGTNCAVAELMVEGGFDAEVEKIVATENNLWLHEMTSPDLARWTEAAGISVQEAGWIQPTYGFCINTSFVEPPTNATCGDTIELTVADTECSSTHSWSLFRNEEISTIKFTDGTTQMYEIPNPTMDGERFTFKVVTSSVQVEGDGEIEHTVTVECEGQDTAPPKKEDPIEDMGTNDTGTDEKDTGTDGGSKKDAAGCSSTGPKSNSWLIFGILFLLVNRRRKRIALNNP